MDARERLEQAWESLAEHPRRALASATGVFWGAAAIVTMLAWGTGFRDHMRSELGRYGRPLLFVIPGATSSGFPGFRAGVPVRSTRRDALVAERENAESVEAIVTEHWARERVLVEVAGRVRRLDLTATDQRFAEFRRFALAAGRFLSSADVERARPVAVLGWEAARELFDPPESAVGRTLRVNGAPFELVGVFDEKSGRQYTNTNRPDNRLLVVPVTAAEARLGFAPEQDRVFVVYPREGMRGPGVFRAVAASLARRGGFHPDDEDALRHFDLTALLGLLDLVHQGFSLFVGVAGTLTLLVGAVGIANYQLALLAERAVEIAVARALGARGRTLALQCALEAALLAGAASLLGVGFGIAACAGLAALAPAGLFPVPVLSARVAVVTAGALVLVALVAALVPALRVRRMEVALALRAST